MKAATTTTKTPTQSVRINQSIKQKLFAQTMPSSLSPLLALSLLCLLLLHSATPTSDHHKRVDVCAKDPKVTPDEVHAGVFIEIGTAERAGVLKDRNGEYCEVALRLNKTHGERTEISFSKTSTRYVADCFDIEFGDRDNNANQGHTPIHCHSMTPTDEHRKVFFTRDGLDDITIKVHSEVLSAAPINAGIFVQNRRVDAEVKMARFSGAVKFSCSHPNPFIHPNLFHGANNLTNELNGENLRDFERKFEYAPTLADAGRYDCSWTHQDAGGSPPPPRTSINAILYQRRINCGANYISDKNESIIIFPASTGDVADETFDMQCQLDWVGDANGLRLQWTEWNETFKGIDVPGVVSNDDGRRMKADFRVTPKTWKTTTTYVCDLMDRRGFEGPAPEACSVNFRVSPIPRMDDDDEQDFRGLYAAIICVIVIFIIAIIICLFHFERTRPCCFTALEKLCCGFFCCPGQMEKLMRVKGLKNDNVSLAPTELTLDSQPSPRVSRLNRNDDKNDDNNNDDDDVFAIDVVSNGEVRRPHNPYDEIRY